MINLLSTGLHTYTLRFCFLRSRLCESQHLRRYFMHWEIKEIPNSMIVYSYLYNDFLVDSIRDVTSDSSRDSSGKYFWLQWFWRSASIGPQDTLQQFLQPFCKKFQQEIVQGLFQGFLQGNLYRDFLKKIFISPRILLGILWDIRPGILQAICPDILSEIPP